MRSSRSIGAASKLVGWLAVLALCLCSSSRAAQQPDILVVVIDDLGIDLLPGIYDQACDDPIAVQTPTIDALAASGVTFDNFHVYPVCSPTRAALISGLEPIKRGNGIGTIVRPFVDAAGFDLRTRTVFWELTANHGYQVGVVGKWHLSVFGEITSAFAQRIGATVVDILASNHDNRDYYDFDTFDGQAWHTYQGTYSTEYITERAIEVWNGLSSPKMAYVSYTAVHKPWHVPPPELTYSDWSWVDPDVDPRSAQKAMLEALDSYLDTLLDAVGPDTFVLLLSDNGTPHETADDCTTPRNQSKGTIYEGGIRVPAIAASPMLQVPGVHIAAPVMVIDLFPTLVQLAGGDPADVPDGYVYDFVPFLDHIVDPMTNWPLRRFVYSEVFVPNRVGSIFQTILNQKSANRNHFKYMRDFMTGAEEFYDLRFGEEVNLIGSIEPGSIEEHELLLLRRQMEAYSVFERVDVAQ